MASIFVEFNNKYKGKIPESLSSIVRELKDKDCMRVTRPVAEELMDKNIGKWVSRRVGKARERR